MSTHKLLFHLFILSIYLALAETLVFSTTNLVAATWWKWNIHFHNSQWVVVAMIVWYFNLISTYHHLAMSLIRSCSKVYLI
jgi:hypothetical protein